MNPAPPSKRSHWVLALLAGLAVCVVLAGAAYYLLKNWADIVLNSTVAEIDRTDPGWRFADIEAARAVVPDDQNSALVVLAVHKLLPEGWDSQELADLVADLPPEVQLNAVQIAALKKELAPVQDGLAEARRLAGLDAGRYPVEWAPDYLSTKLLCQPARGVCRLLDYDTMLAAQEEDGGRAVASVRAMLNSGRSVGDEPVSISQLVRLACRGRAVLALERTLAQAEPPDAALADLQPLLQAEGNTDLLLTMLRGERGGNELTIRDLEANLNPQKLAEDLNLGRGLVTDELLQLTRDDIKFQHATYLRMLTGMVEAARLPLHNRSEPLKQVHREYVPSSPPPVLIGLLMVNADKLHQADQRTLAQIRCALVAVAAERFRQKQGAWPRSLTDLVEARLLSEIPADPFTGQPLCLAALADGIAIYAVGHDGVDNGGTICRTTPFPLGSDIGVRLWNPEARRQPPAAAKKEEPPCP